jgi:hypothetical protein
MTRASLQKKGAFVIISNDSARKLQPIEIDSINSHPAYSIRLSMYKYPPTDSISLPEFERFACDRMKGNLNFELISQFKHLLKSVILNNFFNHTNISFLSSETN